MQTNKSIHKYIVSKHVGIAIAISLTISIYLTLIYHPDDTHRASFFIIHFLVSTGIIIGIIAVIQKEHLRKIRLLNSFLHQEWVDNQEFYELRTDGELGPIVQSIQTMSHQLHRRIEMEQLIADVSSILTTAKDEYFQNFVNESLRKLGVFLQSDRSHLFLFNEGKTRFFPFAQWNRSGLPTRNFSDEGILPNQFPWLIDRLSTEDSVVISSMNDFPEDSERQFWSDSAAGVHSIVFQPLKIKGELIGFLECELLISTYNWNHEELHLLVMFAEVTGASIERVRTDQLMKAQNQQLLQAQKMETVGHLAGGIAHDFNNILAGIVSISSLFRMDHKDDETVTREEFMPFLDTVQEAGTRAAKVVQQLLLLSRKQEYNFAVIDLNRVVRQAAGMAVASFDKRVTISIELCEGKAFTKADSVQIEQVVLNFMMNSVHAMTVMRSENENIGGTLIVKNELLVVDKKFRKIHPAAFEQAYWKLTIIDTGVGIPRENYAKIFDPFFTTKAKGVGTGLGLSMIYRIVQEHYGFVEFDSEVGVGTTFRIYLPMENSVPENVSENGDSNEPEFAAIPAKILVVDDEPVLRKIAARCLEAAGHTVLLAENGGEAVDIFEEQADSIDAVILDLVMPILGGRETYVELKKIRADIPVLISSGFRKDERIDELIAMGVAGFLQKPYTVEEMQAAIRELLLKR